MFDLEDFMTRRNWKRRDTAEDAAHKAEPEAEKLRPMILNKFKETGRDYTADEMAAELNKQVWSIRPRFTELSKKGHLYDSGDRRKNNSGRTAIVWRLSEN